MRRMPILDRIPFPPHPCGCGELWGIRRDFSRLSPSQGQVAYVLLTSAPVADKGIATLSLPLDLHVLSLSLAFILSQDQTLRCCLYYFSSLLQIRTVVNATLTLPKQLTSVLRSPVSITLTFRRLLTCLRKLDE